MNKEQVSNTFNVNVVYYNGKCKLFKAQDQNQKYYNLWLVLSLESGYHDMSWQCDGDVVVHSVTGSCVLRWEWVGASVNTELLTQPHKAALPLISSSAIAATNRNNLEILSWIVAVVVLIIYSWEWMETPWKSSWIAMTYLTDVPFWIMDLHLT